MLKFELKDARFENTELILEWDYIQHNDYFVFYKKNDYSEESGFNFMSLEVIGQYGDAPTFHPNNYVEILYWGYAMFDGIRHLYIGHEKTDNYGYINYPNLKDHIKVLEILRELEIKYCSEIYS